MKHKCYDNLKKEISFLILDYNRPNESKLLLESLKQFVKFSNYEVIYFSNGGRQNYVVDFYASGLIDRLILNRKNDGVGLAQPRMVEFCQTDFFINVQCDRYMFRDFTLEELNHLKSLFNNPKIGAINFTQNLPFSENAFMMNTNFYCQNDLHVGGGPGPYHNLGIGSETTTYDWLVKHDLKVVDYCEQYLFNDNGKYSVIETSTGGIIRKRCDTQQLWIIKPPKEREGIQGNQPNNEEWEKILSGNWKDGEMLESSKDKSFFFFSDKLD